MSYNNNSDGMELKDVRNQLIEMGIYEEGMGSVEMRDLYKTIKNSEKSATEEKEYRETLKVTNKNCAELLELMSETKSPDSRYNLRSKDREPLEYMNLDDSSNDTSNDTYFPTHKEKSNNDQKNTSEVEENGSPVKKTGAQVKNTVVNKNIDVFMPVEVTRQPLKLLVKNDNILQPFYCQPEIQNMPIFLASEAIKKYHDSVISQHKIMQSQSVNLVPWGDGIKITKANTNKEVVEDSPSQNTSAEVKKENYICLRSRRQIKRKLYTEVNSDEDDETFIKKYKDNGSKKENLQLTTTENEADLNVSKTDFEFYANMDKVFDDLKDVENKDTNLSPRKSLRSKDSQSSDDEPSTVFKVSAIVHCDTPAKRKTRWFSQTINRKIVQKKNNELSPAETDGISTIMETTEDELSPPKSANKRKTSDINDSMEEISYVDSQLEESTFVRRRVTPPNPLRDKMSQRSEQKVKNLTRRRNKNPNSLSKPDSQKNNKEKGENDEEEMDEILGISTDSFYGKKNDSKANKVHPNRVSVSPIPEREYACPICDKNFSLAQIERHAATCTRNDLTTKPTQTRKGSSCYACDQFISGDIQEHLENCNSSKN